MASGCDRLVQRERHRQRREPVLLGEGVELPAEPPGPRREQRPRWRAAGQPGRVPDGEPDEGPAYPVPR